MFGVAETRHLVILGGRREQSEEGRGGVVDEVGRGLVAEDGAHPLPDLPRRRLGLLARRPNNLQSSAPFVNPEIKRKGESEVGDNVFLQSSGHSSLGC